MYSQIWDEEGNFQPLVIMHTSVGRRIQHYLKVIHSQMETHKVVHNLLLSWYVLKQTTRLGLPLKQSLQTENAKLWSLTQIPHSDHLTSDMHQQWQVNCHMGFIHGKGL